jgi:hypothetical protein
VVRGRVLGVVVERLRLDGVAITKDEPWPLRHERDRDVEEQIALTQIVAGRWFPVEAVVVLLAHVKGRVQRPLNLGNETDGYSA